jgi:hypothetical protein
MYNIEKIRQIGASGAFPTTNIIHFNADVNTLLKRLLSIKRLSAKKIQKSYFGPKLALKLPCFGHKNAHESPSLIMVIKPNNEKNDS